MKKVEDKITDKIAELIKAERNRSLSLFEAEDEKLIRKAIDACYDRLANQLSNYFSKRIKQFNTARFCNRIM